MLPLPTLLQKELSMGRKKKARRGRPRGSTGQKRTRLSARKKYAIARVQLSGIPASHLAKLFNVSQLSVYQWAKAVKKAKGKNPFEDGAPSLTPKQARLLAVAKRTK